MKVTPSTVWPGSATAGPLLRVEGPVGQVVPAVSRGVASPPLRRQRPCEGLRPRGVGRRLRCPLLVFVRPLTHHLARWLADDGRVAGPPCACSRRGERARACRAPRPARSVSVPGWADLIGCCWASAWAQFGRGSIPAEERRDVFFLLFKFELF
jgi:hypothetical protein